MMVMLSVNERDVMCQGWGTVIESSKSKYVIVKLLGAGGFGAVYSRLLLTVVAETQMFDLMTEFVFCSARWAPMTTQEVVSR
ncbi:unnamed protein product [Heligmosomoides polygyrus]|uniref:Protein kinase domain-containing protein n=1 Tax=Heligmosomoides polygyrus TaxID=6339 RepID=A0A3P7ZXR3_HELPZ|nr:unnamed protein product [Heligmosomoides polygyrus]